MKSVLHLYFAIVIGFGCASCRARKEQHIGIDGDFVNTVPLPSRIEAGGFFGKHVKRGQYQPIHFSFDTFTLDKVERDKVVDIAAAISRLPNSRTVIIVAGFTDSWGTEEYNRALGERRANTVRQALITLGVRGDRLQTVSFGEELPADLGNNPAAWAKNRRVEIGVEFTR